MFFPIQVWIQEEAEKLDGVLEINFVISYLDFYFVIFQPMDVSVEEYALCFTDC